MFIAKGKPLELAYCILPDVSRNATSTANLGPTQTKYEERNPISRFANRTFLRTVVSLMSSIKYGSLLDAGSGEGVVLQQPGVIQHGLTVALDIDPERIVNAVRRLPEVEPIVGSLYALPFRNNSFDAVISLEVLEHLSQPELALQELSRVASGHLLASVPHEPWWRIANMMRFKYLREFGNTPEHVQHWSALGFRRFIMRQFSVLKIRLAFLWTFILAEARRHG